MKILSKVESFFIFRCPFLALGISTVLQKVKNLEISHQRYVCTANDRPKPDNNGNSPLKQEERDKSHTCL